MRTLSKLAVAATMAGAALAFTVTAASAEIVCNNEGDCWHVRHHHYEYKPEFNVVVHPDNWRWHRKEHYHWREHRGRGYWHSGVWVQF